MSEAPAALTSAVAAAVHVDEEDVGVLSLLEDHHHHHASHARNNISAASLSLTTHTPISAADIDAMVVPHDPISHQARAVAALQQAADTASGRQHMPADPIGSGREHPQQQQGRQQFESAQQTSMSVQSATDPHPSKNEPEIPAVTIPLTDPITVTAMTSDFGMASASPHSICLCQAPTRIPRPRNAFILFRQHHHAAVVAQNPGKPNPEISKIIGQMWKGLGDNDKAVWQSHADEEKRQHLQRYPQYRYQPRRSSKKNTATTSPDPTLPAPALESAVCPNCGGLTGALSTGQTPTTPVAARRPPHAAQDTTASSSRGNGPCPDDGASNASASSGNGVAAGIEALLQLGLRNEDDDMIDTSLQLHSKRRKLNPTISSASSSILPQSIYSTQLSDPNIDPYLRQGSFDHESPSTALDPDNDHRLTQFNITEILSIKAVPIFKKIYAINRICPPISIPSVPPFNTPAVTRMPIVSIEGDDVDIVSSLAHSLSSELEKTSPVYLIDEPDDLTVFSEAFLEGLLSGGAGPEKDKETDDVDAARYLNHVASWRSKSSEIKSIATNAQQLVLINRYILSRSDAAALRLSPDGLSPLEHWQWCATVWRSCVGPDLTIYVQTLPGEEQAGMAVAAVGTADTVDTRDGGKIVFVRKATGAREWGEKVIQRLEFEVREMVRNLRGFPT